MDEFFGEFGVVGDGFGDDEEFAFEEDAEGCEEVAAGNAVAAERVGGGRGAGGDGDGDDGGAEVGVAEEFDDGRADTGGVDGQGFVGVDGVAGKDFEVAGEDLGCVADERVDAIDDVEIGEAEGEAFGVAEDKMEFALVGEGDGVALAGGDGGAFEDGDGGVILAAAEVESEEDMGFRKVPARGHGKDEIAVHLESSPIEIDGASSALAPAEKAGDANGGRVKRGVNRAMMRVC